MVQLHKALRILFWSPCLWVQLNKCIRLSLRPSIWQAKWLPHLRRPPYLTNQACSRLTRAIKKRFELLWKQHWHSIWIRTEWKSIRKMPHTAISRVGIKTLIHPPQTRVQMIESLSKWWVSRDQPDRLPCPKKKDVACAWLRSRSEYWRMSSNAILIGALLRSKQLLKGYNLGASRSTNGAGTERRRRLPSLLLPKPQALKMKEATNNNPKPPRVLNSEVQTTMKLIQID